jgi:predicted nucleic acid-binding protein
VDLLIAATTLHHGLSFVTRNLEHFRRVPGLTVHELP